MMNSKENLLEAIRFGSPDYVPMTNEDCSYGIALDGNYRRDNWTDLWGVRWEVGIDGTVPFPKGYPLPDLERIDDYRFPSINDLTWPQEEKEKLAVVDHSEKLVMGWLIYFIFERAWALMGMDNFLLAFHTHPEEMKYLLQRIADFNIAYFDRMLELGVDGVAFTEDLGSQKALMISPEMFREFFLPEYRRCFAHILEAGKIIYFHSCGCIETVAGDLAKAGVTILNPVQANANNQQTVRQETFGRTAIEGATNARILVDGTPKDVRKEVERVMNIFKPGSGFIFGMDEGISNLPQENLDVMWKTARQLGKY